MEVVTKAIGSCLFTAVANMALQRLIPSKLPSALLLKARIITLRQTQFRSLKPRSAPVSFSQHRQCSHSLCRLRQERSLRYECKSRETRQQIWHTDLQGPVKFQSIRLQLGLHLVPKVLLTVRRSNDKTIRRGSPSSIPIG